MENKLTEQEKFEKLVECAEKFIEINAMHILNKLRQQESKSCSELIEGTYKPMIEDINQVKDDDFKKTVIKRMCIQLQNYQRMPQALDYASYSYHPEEDNGDNIDLCSENNEIFQYTYKKITGNVETTQEEIYEQFSKYYDEKVYKDGKYNFALKKYSKGLADFIEKTRNDKNYFETIKNDCNKLDKLAQDGKIKEIEKILNKFSKDIYYLSTTLSYDFFKELFCKNLVKPDIHIKEIFKRYIYENRKLPNDNQIACDFINMCKRLNRTPYYIDKIIWLCCTGQFYEDGIIINKMTRRNFFKFVDGKLNVQ